MDDIDLKATMNEMESAYDAFVESEEKMKALLKKVKIL